LSRRNITSRKRTIIICSIISGSAIFSIHRLVLYDLYLLADNATTTCFYSTAGPVGQFILWQYI
jgi:hypothetical protein